MRPRGWHLHERHIEVDGRRLRLAVRLRDSTWRRNHERLAALGSGPYFYLPKLESHVEAGLWSGRLRSREDVLGLARGTILRTV